MTATPIGNRQAKEWVWVGIKKWKTNRIFNMNNKNLLLLGSVRFIPRRTLWDRQSSVGVWLSVRNPTDGRSLSRVTGPGSRSYRSRGLSLYFGEDNKTLIRRTAFSDFFTRLDPRFTSNLFRNRNLWQFQNHSRYVRQALPSCFTASTGQAGEPNA